MKAFRPFFVIMAFALTVGMACLVGGNSTQPPVQPPSNQTTSSKASGASQAASSAPASSAKSQAASSSTGSGASSGQFFTDSFDSDTMKNYTVENRKQGSDTSKMDVSIKGGNMVFNLTGPNLWVYVTYKPQTYSDVKVTVTADNRGKNNNNVSLICRESSDGWYEFNIANNGLYNILAYDKTGAISKGYNNIYNGGSLAIKQGKGVNVYVATCKGNTLSLEINGVLAKTIADNKFDFSEGTIGFSVSSFDVTPILVDIQSLQVSQP